MSERLAFIQACLNRSERIVEICSRFEISEKTGQKWLARFRAGGEAALGDRSHATHTGRHRLEPEVIEAIIRLRKQHRQWGAAKLRDRLMQRDPTRHWPAASTIGELLQRAHLIRTTRRHPAVAHARLASGRTEAAAPNVVWTADFKGHFRLGSGDYCYPLTVLDLHSHFLLRCAALSSTAVPSVRQVFARLFAEYGLPMVLRTDNGVPFAQPNALGRLGALALWWVRLGIRPEHTRPATPSENGAHERFHKTLKAGATRPASVSMPAQQRRFDRFQRVYNLERPHASLANHRPPADAYTASPRPYPRTLPDLVYPTATVVRCVQGAGAIKWRGHGIFLSSNLAGQEVSLTEVADDRMRIHYANLLLGEFDLHTARFLPDVRWDG